MLAGNHGGPATAAVGLRPAAGRCADVLLPCSHDRRRASKVVWHTCTACFIKHHDAAIQVARSCQGQAAAAQQHWPWHHQQCPCTVTVTAASLSTSVTPTNLLPSHPSRV
jgi:hypothetical protein